MNRKLRKLMDCCRPGRMDQAEPEMVALAKALSTDPQARQLWESQQAWDRQVTQAMAHVRVPPGLADRLLASLEPVDAPGDNAPGDNARTEQAPSSLRRTMMSWPAVTAAVVAASVLVALTVWLGDWSDALTNRQVAEAARGWVQQLDQMAWLRADPPDSSYPLDPSVLMPVVAWQRLNVLGDSQAVAYLAQMPDRSNAYLFVIRSGKGRQLRPLPPSEPDSTTGNLCVGVWKSNDCIYVLMVPGSKSQYQQRLRATPFA